ncbi:MAG TPA: hypothetical protein VFG94_13435 [Acidimicrobiales bacterium]|nr:hypothetical protein [Acidimicrobiales bacterium]
MSARRIGSLLLAAMLAGGGLAACGDDGGNDDEAVEEVDDTADDSTDDTADDSSDDTSDDSSDDTFPSGIFGSEECQEVIEAFAAVGGVFSGTDSEFNFGDLADGLENLGDSAPEISDDLELLADAYRDFSDALGDDVDFSDPDIFTSPEFAEAAEAFNSAEFTAASDRISEFMDEACDTSG